MANAIPHDEFYMHTKLQTAIYEEILCETSLKHYQMFCM